LPLLAISYAVIVKLLDLESVQIVPPFGAMAQSAYAFPPQEIANKLKQLKIIFLNFI
jgi:hypothetical protein